MNLTQGNNMDTTAEIIRLLRELNEELKDDNDAYDNRKKKEIQTAATTEEKKDD